MGGRPKDTFLQIRHTEDQEAYEKCSTSLIIREIRSKNYSEVAPDTGQNGYHQKICK